MKSKCSNCSYWELSDGLNGICHKYAPRPTILQGKEGHGTFVIVWPMTRKDDWCGDFNQATLQRQKETIDERSANA